ncbi:MAG: DNA polymerase III subunit delta [Pseudomonadota bacterium]
MKLGGAQATAYFKAPNLKHAAALLFGTDAMRVDFRKKQMIAAIAGDTAEEEMRLERLSGAELRKTPAALLDGVKAQGFFPGQRLVVIEDATDGLSKTAQQALDDWRDGDAYMLFIAGSLNARSKLRAVIEASNQAVAIGIYNDPPQPQEIMEQAAKAGLMDFEPEAKEALIALGQALDMGDFAQMLTKLSLYMGKDKTVSLGDIDAMSPAAIEAGLDDILYILADGKSNEVGPFLKRLFGQGMNPTTIVIAASRYFRQLHLASLSGSADQALSRMRPPVFGPRKTKMAGQIRRWGTPRLERAAQELFEIDLTLRSSPKAPVHALLERSFIRISMMHPK